MAMNGPFALEFWKTCEVELDTLENEMKTWTYVEQTPDMRVLPSTWALKIKRFPDGEVKKFKARFCVRGDHQEHGINYWETWSPVVQWSTIRTLMILAAKENLVSAQCDITAAFVTAPIPPDEVVYVHQPCEFVKGTTRSFVSTLVCMGCAKVPSISLGTSQKIGGSRTGTFKA